MPTATDTTLTPRPPRESITRTIPAPPSTTPALMLANRDAAFYGQQMRLARMAGMPNVAESYADLQRKAERLARSIKTLAEGKRTSQDRPPV